MKAQKILVSFLLIIGILIIAAISKKVYQTSPIFNGQIAPKLPMIEPPFAISPLRFTGSQ